MTSRAAALGLLVVLLASCSGASAPPTMPRQGGATTLPASTTAPVPASTTALPPPPPTTTSTVPSAATTTPTTLGATDEPSVIAERCAASSFVADVDGDGRSDSVYHRYFGSDARLGVCTAAGEVDEVEGAGMTEVLLAFDIEGDGAFEVFYGGTSVLAQFTSIAVFADGSLAEVVDGDGVGFFVIDGFLGPEGPRLAVGCWDVDGDGVTDLVQAEFAQGADSSAVADGDRVAWTRRGYRIDGAVAVELGETSGEVAAPLSPAVIRSVVGDCPAGG